MVKIKMNVKKYIHPRNKYKNPPNYKQLTIMYPEFREVSIVDFTGKVRIDFQNKESLRVLTETLLKHDFDLYVSIPSNNLNPAITLRMNYILWIEDLMTHSKLEMNKVIGIDIGTGAICIYALLLAKIYGCRVIGTEVDEKSINYAEKCIRRNNLQDLIKVNSDRIFKDAIENGKMYDFSMCNPPFFKSEDDEKITKALPPRNAPTGNDSELKIEGGEVAFVMKMVDESIELGDQIKIYSTMIGRKADLFHLKKLIKSRNIENVTWTEFCQGYTTRWGLAWSFLPKSIIDLSTAPVIRKSGKSMVQILRKNCKTSITVPKEDKFSCMNDLISFLKTTAEKINIKLQEVPVHEDNFNGWMCQIIVRERSWEHSRRKRRLAQREIALKKLKSESSEYIETNVPQEILNIVSIIKENDNSEQVNKNSLDKPSAIQIRNNISNQNEENSIKEVSENHVPLLVCKLCIQIESPDCDNEEFAQNDIFRIWMVFENGSGGLDALQSLRQYLINKLEVNKKIYDNLSKPIKKRRKKTRNSSSGNDTSIEQFLSDNKNLSVNQQDVKSSDSS